jgi:Helix-turn-helix domain
MMAGMLTQLPLPLLPAGAAEIAPGVGLVTGADGGGLVSVQLVRLRAVSQVQAAAAFGVDPVTVWRWDQALAAGGVAGLVPARGPHRLRRHPSR